MLTLLRENVYKCIAWSKRIDSRLADLLPVIITMAVWLHHTHGSVVLMSIYISSDLSRIRMPHSLVMVLR